jgi:ribosomal protein S12 methylthiotransferase
MLTYNFYILSILYFSALAIKSINYTCASLSLLLPQMKTKTLKKNKVNVVTLGCSKNIFDSEVLMAQLKANNFDVTHESSDMDASVVIINTCGFIENAKQESIDTILAYADAKKEGLVDKLLVTGCLSERYKPELEKEIPEVDAYFGTRDLPRLLKTLKADYKHELIGERLLTTPIHYAYMKNIRRLRQTLLFLCNSAHARQAHFYTH